MTVLVLSGVVGVYGRDICGFYGRLGVEVLRKLVGEGSIGVKFNRC